MNHPSDLDAALQKQQSIDKTLKELNNLLDDVQRAGFDVKITETCRLIPSTSSGHKGIKVNIIATLGET